MLQLAKKDENTQRKNYLEIKKLKKKIKKNPKQEKIERKEKKRSTPI